MEETRKKLKEAEKALIQAPSFLVQILATDSAEAVGGLKHIGGTSLAR